MAKYISDIQMDTKIYFRRKDIAWKTITNFDYWGGKAKLLI